MRSTAACEVDCCLSDPALLHTQDSWTPRTPEHLHTLTPKPHLWTFSWLVLGVCSREGAPKATSAFADSLLRTRRSASMAPNRQTFLKLTTSPALGALIKNAFDVSNEPAACASRSPASWRHLGLHLTFSEVKKH